MKKGLIRKLDQGFANLCFVSDSKSVLGLAAPDQWKSRLHRVRHTSTSHGGLLVASGLRARAC